jgi:hypothetical protein
MAVVRAHAQRQEGHGQARGGGDAELRGHGGQGLGAALRGSGPAEHRPLRPLPHCRAPPSARRYVAALRDQHAGDAGAADGAGGAPSGAAGRCRHLCLCRGSRRMSLCVGARRPTPTSSWTSGWRRRNRSRWSSRPRAPRCAACSSARAAQGACAVQCRAGSVAPPALAALLPFAVARPACAAVWWSTWSAATTSCSRACRCAPRREQGRTRQLAGLPPHAHLLLRLLRGPHTGHRPAHARVHGPAAGRARAAGAGLHLPGLLRAVGGLWRPNGLRASTGSSFGQSARSMSFQHLSAPPSLASTASATRTAPRAVPSAWWSTCTTRLRQCTRPSGASPPRSRRRRQAKRKR